MFLSRAAKILTHFQPVWWWLEFPRSRAINPQAFPLEKYPLDIDFCKFSNHGCSKPTRFWGSKAFASQSPVLCAQNCLSGFQKKNGKWVHSRHLKTEKLNNPEGGWRIFPESLLMHLLHLMERGDASESRPLTTPESPAPGPAVVTVALNTRILAQYSNQHGLGGGLPFRVKNSYCLIWFVNCRTGKNAPSKFWSTRARKKI